MVIELHYFNLAILFFIVVILLLIGFILIYMHLRIKRSHKLHKWKLMANLLIRKAIFYEETEDDPANNIPITSRTKRLLLKNSHFRKLLTDELLNAKKNVSGSSAENLKHLYIQLGLHQYALAELKNYKWYIKAQAIQELSIMGLKENLTSVYRFTNNANELVRMEAQIAVVNFYGFEGLRFLDVISHPVTEWQQIQLLHELSHTTENFSGIEKWLKSENKTVVAFALKLAGNYHRFELHDSIVECLEDLDPNVRLQAIISLGEIYTDKTSEILISRYLIEDIKHQMAIVKVLQNIATNDDIPILLDQLNNENAALKLMVARTLAKIGADGFKSLQHHYQAQQYPLAEIIAQIKNELAL